MSTDGIQNLGGDSDLIGEALNNNPTKEDRYILEDNNNNNNEDDNDEITEDDVKTYKIFSAQLYALGHINAYKNKHLRRAIIFFGTAILSELLIVMSMAWGRALQFLFPA